MFGFKTKQNTRPTTGATGQWGEALAERHLKAQHYRILGRRVRVGRRDEIDLIARASDGETMVFVEVKTRQHDHYGRPFDAVDRAKRLALSRAAVRYLQKLKTPPFYIRFDVIEVLGSIDGPVPEIRHIENAFPLNRRYTPPC